MGSKCPLKQHACILYLLHSDVPILQSVKDLAIAEAPQELGLYSNTTNMYLQMMFCAGHRLGLIISTDLKLFNPLSLALCCMNSLSQFSLPMVDQPFPLLIPLPPDIATNENMYRGA